MARQQGEAGMVSRGAPHMLMESPPCLGHARPIGNLVVRLADAAAEARLALRSEHACDVMDLGILSDEEAIALLDLLQQEQRA